MSPERQCSINEVKVQEFYWNGKKIVYVDNRLVNLTFEEAINALRTP